MQAGKPENIRIRDWKNDDKPREKLLSKGPQALSDSELLAILLRTGSPGHNATDLARAVLKMGEDSLLRLGRLTASELKRMKGMGIAKATVIAAAMELCRRWQKEEELIPGKTQLKSGQEAARYLRDKLRYLPHEVFAAIYLNNAGTVLKFDTLSHGGLTGTVADPRIILKKALEENAISIILGHNHPSGNLRPSKADEEFTNKIKKGAGYLDIKLLDHIIVSEKGYFSFADRGLL